MKMLPQCFEVSKGEYTKKGVIRLTHRKLFDFAKACPVFCSMEDEEERPVAQALHPVSCEAL